MASKKGPVKFKNIYELLNVEEDLTIQTTDLPNYADSPIVEEINSSIGEDINEFSSSDSSSSGKEEEKEEGKEESKEDVVWKDNSKRKKKYHHAAAGLIEDARIAPVYQIFKLLPDVSDFDILEKIKQVNIEEVEGLKIVQDRSLIYGTKIRGVEFFYKIKELGYKGITTATAAYAPSQIAIAWMCAQAGLKLHMFVSGCKNKLITPYTQRAIELGATVNMGKTIGFTFRHYSRVKIAEDTLATWLKTENPTDWYTFATGCAEDGYMQAVVNNLKEVKSKYELNPPEIWIVGVTGLIAACLSQAFPDSVIHCVSISNTIWPDLFKTKNYQIHQYPLLNLGGITTEYPFDIPFASTPNFGSKVMFFSGKMKPGSIIWNVY